MIPGYCSFRDGWWDNHQPNISRAEVWARCSRSNFTVWRLRALCHLCHSMPSCHSHCFDFRGNLRKPRLTYIKMYWILNYVFHRFSCFLGHQSRGLQLGKTFRKTPWLLWRKMVGGLSDYALTSALYDLRFSPITLKEARWVTGLPWFASSWKKCLVDGCWWFQIEILLPLLDWWEQGPPCFQMGICKLRKDLWGVEYTNVYKEPPTYYCIPPPTTMWTTVVAQWTLLKVKTLTCRVSILHSFEPCSAPWRRGTGMLLVCFDIF